MAHDYLIIGGGIAGAAMAHELRGRDVLVVDAADIASGASGNPKGIIRPFLSLGKDAMRDFYEAAYFYCLEVMEKLSVPVLQRGILQFPKDESEKRFSTAPILAGFSEQDLQYFSAQQAENFLQTDCHREALFWPRAAVVEPAAWVRALLGNTPTRTQTKITKIYFDNAWLAVTDRDEIITAKNIIVAGGYATDLIPVLAAQLRPRMGQITLVPHAHLPSLLQAISFGHYFIPSQNSEDHIIGATYEHSVAPALTVDGHQRNITALQNLARVLPIISDATAKLNPDICTGRAAVRATTTNHLPLYGMAAPGLYYLTGLGSRGMMSAPYTAQQLYQQITD